MYISTLNNSVTKILSQREDRKLKVIRQELHTDDSDGELLIKSDNMIEIDVLQPKYYDIEAPQNYLLIQSNGYYAHPENMLLCILRDERKHIRELGLRRLLKANSEQKNEHVTVEDLTKYISESREDSLMHSVDFPRFPCQTEALERVLKLVTESLLCVCGPKKETGMSKPELLHIRGFSTDHFPNQNYLITNALKSSRLRLDGLRLDYAISRLEKLIVYCATRSCKVDF
ncbi:hypothetical protein J6590_098514 [Homalodisca vitripennis]|nr:hypothetical protein J6590_098514 [Homalodisca vitripennis]